MRPQLTVHVVFTKQVFNIIINTFENNSTSVITFVIDHIYFIIRGQLKIICDIKYSSEAEYITTE